MSLSPAMRAAERARKKFQPVSAGQRKALKWRSVEAGVELPQVRTKAQAGDALDRLKLFLTPPPQQQLDGFGEAMAPERTGGKDAYLKACKPSSQSSLSLALPTGCSVPDAKNCSEGASPSSSPARSTSLGNCSDSEIATTTTED